jgi:hypothetical protein
VSTVEITTADLDPGLDAAPPRMPTINSIPSRHEMNVLVEIATAASVAGSGTPQACLLKMLYGRAAGIDPTIALAEIDLIPTQGGIKPTLNARTKVALIRRRELGDVRLVEYDDAHAIVDAWRTDQPDQHYRFEFNDDDMRRAGLHTKNNHRMWPQSMKIARAQGLACNALFQEVFLGLAYTADELGAETDEAGHTLALPPPVDNGIIKRKNDVPPPTITPTEAETAVKQVFYSTTNVATCEACGGPGGEAQHVGKCPDCGRPGRAPLAETRLSSAGSQELLRLKDEIKVLAQTQLKFTREQWRQIRPRFGPENSELNLVQLQRLHRYLRDLWQLTWLHEELRIPSDKWQAALERRGAQTIEQLSQAAALELVGKLTVQISPFNLNKAVAKLNLVLGRSANATDVGGNELLPMALA